MRGRGRRVVLVAGLVLGLGAIGPAPTEADTSASRPIWPSIVVGDDNRVHVAYDNADGAGIIYATNVSGRWTRTRVTNGNDSLPRITVDDLGKVRMIFVRTFTDKPRRLYYATNCCGSWSVSQLPFTAPGSTVRMAVAPDRRLHVVYATDEAAWYATNDSGSWTTERLDHSFGSYPAVAVGDDGTVHITFGQCLNDGQGTCEGEGIYYRTNRSGTSHERWISDFQGDRTTSIAVDGSGAVHIVFDRPFLRQGREELGTGLFYMNDRAGRLINRSGLLNEVLIHTDGRKGRLAVEADGTAHIVYNLESETRRGIYYATNASGSWARSTAVSEYAMYQELGVDTAGNARLVFMRMAIDPGVYYAKHTSSGWSRLELMD